MKELTLIEAMFLLAKQECSDEARILLQGIDSIMNEADIHRAYSEVVKEYEKEVDNLFNKGLERLLNKESSMSIAHVAWLNIRKLQEARDLMVSEI